MSKAIIMALAPLYLAVSYSTVNAAMLTVADDNAPPVKRVNAADLDLRNPADRVVLDHRIRRAAEAVCPEAQTLELNLMRLRAECQRAALRGTEQQVAVLVAKAGQHETVLAQAQTR